MHMYLAQDYTIQGIPVEQTIYIHKGYTSGCVCACVFVTISMKTIAHMYMYAEKYLNLMTVFH